MFPGPSLRLAVEERAKTFDCLEAVSHLSIIDAVRFLQEQEQYTPCFGAETPLMPLPEHASPALGLDREKLCGVFECYWRLSCDTFRTMPTASWEKPMNEEVVREMDELICRPEFDSAPDTRQRVEKAAELLDVAAEALPVTGDSAEMQDGREETVAGILNRLAESAATFMSVVQELAQQSTITSRAVRHELNHLQGSFDKLAGAVSEQQTTISATQEQYEQLSAVVQGVNERHDAEMGSLREDAREQTAGISGRLEELSARLEGHDVAFSGLHARVESLIPLHAVVADLSSRVAVWCERLDRQGEVLHSLCEMQAQRTAALHHFYEVLSRIEASAILPSSSGPEESRAAAY